MSQCGEKEWEGKSFVVNIYNPLGQYINKYIRVPVTHKYKNTFYNFRVIDSAGILIVIYNCNQHHCEAYFIFPGKLLPSQLIPIPSFVVSIPGRNTTANHELIFMATNVPPLGSNSYYIEASESRTENHPSISSPSWNSYNSSDQIKNLTISNEVSIFVLIIIK